MIYDSHPPYAHHAHLRYAHEPYKFIYVLSRLTTTLLLVPIWFLYYSILPRSARPRTSWNLRQIIHVNFTRRIYKVTERAGVTWGTRNPTEDGGKGLRETRFLWVDSLDEGDELRRGVVCEGNVDFGTKVGCFVWPKEERTVMKTAKKDFAREQTSKKPVIGIFMHGGGYCHMSAHEASRTSRIPRQLIKRNLVDEVYSVEYRLLQHAPFPAALQDAAAVYAHVVRKLYDATKCTILLIGDSSGGNLALALARWIRDEGVLPSPDGLLLLSPTSDPSHALPETLSHIRHVHTHTPRPNAESDYLVDTPEPRALLHRTFLGFSPFLSSSTSAQHDGNANGNDNGPPRNHDEECPEDEEEELDRLRRVVHSEYVSPCSPVVLRRWGHEDVVHEDVGPWGRDDEEGDLEAGEVNPNANGNPNQNQNRKTLFGGFPRTFIVCGDAERLTREVSALVRAMRKDFVREMVGEGEGEAGLNNINSDSNASTSSEVGVSVSPDSSTSLNPNPNTEDANESNAQAKASEHVQIFWARDACHDILILPEDGFWVWDQAVVKQVWGAIAKWFDGL